MLTSDFLELQNDFLQLKEVILELYIVSGLQFVSFPRDIQMLLDDANRIQFHRKILMCLAKLGSV